MARFKTRPRPLKNFALQPTFTALERVIWEESLPKVAWYQLPVEQEYDHPSGGKYVRCRVEAFDSQRNSLGFLPLPLRYRDHWIQLCYTIVHTRCEWDAWVGAVPSGHSVPGLDQNLIQHAAKQNGARLLYYLAVRRQIVDELLSHTMAASGADHLEVFDEFLIRDAKGWLWKEYKELASSQRVWMGADPAHPQNAPHFDWRLQGHLAPELLPPKDDSSWVRGKITHYDFQQSWNRRLKNVVSFYRNKALRKQLEESTFRPRANRYPGTWHEGQAPEVRFLTAEQDLAFNHPQKSTPSSPPTASRPSGAASLPLDCPEARALIGAFADLSRAAEIPPTILALERLFGERFDRALWSKVLDSLAFNEGEEAQMTVDQAWGLVIAAREAASPLSSALSAPDAEGQGREVNTPGPDAEGGDREANAPGPDTVGGYPEVNAPNSEAGGTDREARMQEFLSQDMQML